MCEQKMNDLAEAIVKRAQEIEDSEDVSYIKMSINTSKTCWLQITKTKRYIRINNAELGVSYKIDVVRELQGVLKQVWRLVLTDLIQGVLRSAHVINNGIGMAWMLSKEGPLGLFEYTAETITAGSMNIDRLVAFACLVSGPGLSMEKMST